MRRGRAALGADHEGGPPDRADRSLTLDLHDVGYCDLAGTALLLHGGGGACRPDRSGGRERAARSAAEPGQIGVLRKPSGDTGANAARLVIGLRVGVRAAADGAAFLGEALIALVRIPERRRMMQPAEVIRYADQAGVRSSRSCCSSAS